jgi:hypothetical protein
MGEILGLGLSHFPGFIFPDEEMAMRVKETIKSPRVPAALKDPKNWPAAIQQEWGQDEGAATARRHREVFLRGVRRLRRALDDFRPDFVLIFGDDQYENFQEDIVPPFCVYIYDSVDTQPFLRGRGGAPRPNVWGEPFDKTFTVKGHPQAARFLARRLLEDGFDIPYAYKTHHHAGLGHAFINTIMYLDYDRQGWDYPTIPVHVNAYGSSLVRNRGGSSNLFSPEERDADPPAPSPRRCFEVGQALARLIQESPWRAVIVGSSSWSHAFLTAKNSWVYPDVESDRKRLQELRASNYTAWRDLPLKEIEDAGEHELLNWVGLAGAMHQLGQKAEVVEYIESYLMNSSKCFALMPPRVPVGRAEEAAGAARR